MRNHTLQANVTSVCNANFPIPISTYFDIFLFMLSVLTFIVGVTSWTFIKKFRLFKNYILLSIIFNNATNAAIRNINVQCYFENATNLETVFIIYFVLYIFFRISLNYWLLILCYVFYLDLAKVYNNHISRRYLKANLFGWVLPLIVTIFNSIVMKYITKKTYRICVATTNYGHVYTFDVEFDNLFDSCSGTGQEKSQQRGETSMFFITYCFIMLKWNIYVNNTITSSLGQR